MQPFNVAPSRNHNGGAEVPQQKPKQTATPRPLKPRQGRGTPKSLKRLRVDKEGGKSVQDFIKQFEGAMRRDRKATSELRELMRTGDGALSEGNLWSQEGGQRRNTGEGYRKRDAG